MGGGQYIARGVVINTIPTGISCEPSGPAFRVLWRTAGEGNGRRKENGWMRRSLGLNPLLAAHPFSDPWVYGVEGGNTEGKNSDFGDWREEKKNSFSSG